MIPLEPHPHTGLRGGRGSLTRRNDNSLTDVWHKQGHRSAMIHRDHESSLDPQGANQVDDTQAGHTGEGIWQRGRFHYNHRQPYSVSCEHPRHRAGFLWRLGFTRHICVCVVYISPRKHADMYHTGSWKVTRAEDWVKATHSTDRHWTEDQGLILIFINLSWSFLVLLWFFLLTCWMSYGSVC